MDDTGVSWCGRKCRKAEASGGGDYDYKLTN
jgi:hypothetical protein